MNKEEAVVDPIKVDEYIQLTNDYVTENDDVPDPIGDSIGAQHRRGVRGFSTDNGHRGFYGRGRGGIYGSRFPRMYPLFGYGRWLRPRWWGPNFIRYLPLTISAALTGYLISSALYRYYYYDDYTNTWYHPDYFGIPWRQDPSLIPPSNVRFTEEDVERNLRDQRFQNTYQRPPIEILKQLQREGRLIRVEDDKVKVIGQNETPLSVKYQQPKKVENSSNSVGTHIDTNNISQLSSSQTTVQQQQNQPDGLKDCSIQ